MTRVPDLQAEFARHAVAYHRQGKVILLVDGGGGMAPCLEQASQAVAGISRSHPVREKIQTAYFSHREFSFVENPTDPASLKAAFPSSGSEIMPTLEVLINQHKGSEPLHIIVISDDGPINEPSELRHVLKAASYEIPNLIFDMILTHTSADRTQHWAETLQKDLPHKTGVHQIAVDKLEDGIRGILQDRMRVFVLATATELLRDTSRIARVPFKKRPPGQE